MTGSAGDSISSGEWFSGSVSETFALGLEIAGQLRGGEILLLDGDFGAGKTVLAKGIAVGLGIDELDVMSPSFTLVNRHDGGRLTLYHLDLYRLPEGFSAAHAVDLDELLTDEQAVIVIEWAARIEGYPFPSSSVWYVQIDGDEARRIRITRR